jgi:hypothetical protein
VAEEWDWNKNQVDPREVHYLSHTKAWWRCKKNHSWEARIGSRVIEGTGCPYCSGQLAVAGMNDFKTVYPQLASEWDYSKNINDPGFYKPFSHARVWWLCHESHSYSQLISKRTTRGTGCPQCSVGRGNSKAEFELQELLQSMGVEVILGSRSLLVGNMELDLYLPDFHKAIEFNGEWTHSNEILCSQSKKWNSACHYHQTKKDVAWNAGIELAFVWEHDWQKHRKQVIGALTQWVAKDNLDSVLTRVYSAKDISLSCCNSI